MRLAPRLTLALCLAVGIGRQLQGQDIDELVERLISDRDNSAQAKLLERGVAALPALTHAAETLTDVEAWELAATTLELALQNRLQSFDAELEAHAKPAELVEALTHDFAPVGYGAASALAQWTPSIQAQTPLGPGIPPPSSDSIRLAMLTKLVQRAHTQGAGSGQSLSAHLLQLGYLASPIVASLAASADPADVELARGVLAQVETECVARFRDANDHRRRLAEDWLYSYGASAQEVLGRMATSGKPDVEHRARGISQRIKWRVSRALFESLGHTLEGFEEQAWMQRRFSVFLIEKQGGREAVPTLRQVLVIDPSPGVKIAAAEGLARLGDPLGMAFLTGSGLEPLLQSPAMQAAIAMDQGIRQLKIGRTKRAIVEFDRVLALQPANETALYNIACAYALDGGSLKALEYLERAIAAGFADWEHMLEDRDLESLRELAAFRKLVDRIRNEREEREQE